MTVLEKNLACLKKSQSDLARQIEKAFPLKELTVTTSRRGDPVPGMIIDGKTRLYHSRFDPVREGEKNRKLYEKPGLKVFLGLGGAYHILPFSQADKILILEPNLSHLKALLSSMDYTALFARKNTFLLTLERITSSRNWLKTNYIPLLDGGFHLIPLRSQTALFPDVYETESHIIKETLEEISGDCSTMKRLGRSWQRNIIRNLNHTLKSPALPFKQKKAILAAAGPGLTVQEDRFRNRDSNTLLITVDTALPLLQEWGITPDYVVLLDPQAISYLHFMKNISSETRVLADLGSSLPSSVPRENVEWFITSHPLLMLFADYLSPFPLVSQSGGNVTQAALSLLMMGGIEEITVAGADFSYPRGVPYARGTYFFPWFSSRSGRLIPLEDHFGRFVFDQASLEKRGEITDHIYSTIRMEGYRNNFISLIESSGYRWEERERGLWTIKGSAPGPKKKTGGSQISLRSALQSYADSVARRDKDNLHSPLASTLLPLAYSLWNDESSTDVLEKSARYTLNLLNSHK